MLVPISERDQIMGMIEQAGRRDKEEKKFLLNIFFSLLCVHCVFSFSSNICPSCLGMPEM
jgi:hypothetical protein